VNGTGAVWSSSSRSSSSKDASAARLALLDPLDDLLDDVRPRGDVHAEFGGLQLDGRAAGHLGDEDALVVADDLRVQVVVHLRRHLDRRRVQPGLVRERGRPDVGRVGVRCQVRDLGDRVRDALHLGQAAVGQDVPPHLGDQAADHGEQIRVAGALPVAVGGPLHVRRAGIHGGQGVGHRATRVVLGVDAEPDAGAPLHVGHDVVHAHRQHAAVGVAQHADVRTGRGGGVEQPHAVVRVELVAVEEVLAVEEDAAAVLAQERHRVAHHRDVLLRRGAQRLAHVPHRGFRDDAHDRRAGVEQGADLRVVLHRDPGLAGRAERDELRVPELQLAVRGTGEELGVLGQRAGPAALDEADAELVEQPRHRELVGDRVADALTLRPVAQRGVEDVERVGLHEPSSSVGSGETKNPPRDAEGCASVKSWYRRATR
jgi:hypothetical protein